MPDNLAIIRHIIEEHQTIRRHIKLVGDATSDKEALAVLEKTHADLIPGQLEVMSEKLNKLQQTMSLLDEGLKNHFAFEEKALPPLLGELVMQGLVIQHREVLTEIDRDRATLQGIKLDKLNREALLSEDSGMQQIVNSVYVRVEKHTNDEEVILDMVQRALESEKR